MLMPSSLRRLELRPLVSPGSVPRLVVSARDGRSAVGSATLKLEPGVSVDADVDAPLGRGPYEGCVLIVVTILTKSFELETVPLLRTLGLALREAARFNNKGFRVTGKVRLRLGKC